MKNGRRNLHKGMPSSLAKALTAKCLWLGKKLHEKYNCDDMEAYRFMEYGVKLTGMRDTPACYTEKIEPAKLSQSNWSPQPCGATKQFWDGKVCKVTCNMSPTWSRLQLRSSSWALWRTPFNSEAEDDKFVGHSSWAVFRRFVPGQGSELKPRPMDVCLKKQLNPAFTSTSYLTCELSRKVWLIGNSYVEMSYTLWC